jgi:hypothetical protein
VPWDNRTAQAGAFLRLLLLRPSEYRATWAEESDRSEPGTLDYAAIGRVLARVATQPGGVPPGVPLEQWCTGAARRALDGDQLDLSTLDLFIDGFGFTTRHAHRLRELLRGSQAIRVISGQANMPPGLYRGGPQPHDTLSLHDSHTLGPDGLPAEHDTIQLIKSNVDSLVSFPYYFDTDELVVEVVRGGRMGDRIFRVGDGLFGLDIVLTEPLAMGQTALLQLHTTFAYRSPPPAEFRRGIVRSIEDLTIWVTFHPDRVPARVWSARWDRLDYAKIIEEEPAELDGEHSVHARLGAVRNAIVGFHWDWD